MSKYIFTPLALPDYKKLKKVILSHFPPGNLNAIHAYRPVKNLSGYILKEKAPIVPLRWHQNWCQMKFDIPHFAIKVIKIKKNHGKSRGFSGTKEDNRLKK